MGTALNAVDSRWWGSALDPRSEDGRFAASLLERDDVRAEALEVALVVVTAAEDCEAAVAADPIRGARADVVVVALVLVIEEFLFVIEVHVCDGALCVSVVEDRLRGVPLAEEWALSRVLGVEVFAVAGERRVHERRHATGEMLVEDQVVVVVHDAEG